MPSDQSYEERLRQQQFDDAVEKVRVLTADKINLPDALNRLASTESAVADLKGRVEKLEHGKPDSPPGQTKAGSDSQSVAGSTETKSTKNGASTT